MLRADGARFLADISSCLFVGEDGATYTSLSLVDVSDRSRMERSMRLLADAGAALGASLDLDRALAGLREVLAGSDEEVCVLDLLEGDVRRRVWLAGDAGPTPGDPVAWRGSGSDGCLARALRSSEPALVPEVDDAWRAAAAHDDPPVPAAADLRSLLVVPLLYRGECLGALTLGVRARPRRYDAHDLAVAQRLADNVALAIENARNHRAAVDAKRLRDEMLGIVSHDLRNPLNVVVLHARLIARMYPEARETAAEITRAAKYANHLIEDLLVAASSEDRKLALRRAEESAGSIVEEVLALARPLADDQGVRLVADVAADLPAALVDRHRVVQLLSNLVTNAIKFTPADGVITVGARADAARWIVTVRDTGAGIAPEQLPHIFDRFWQGAHARRSDVGLGLSIVRGIAEAHGGDLAVVSAPGEGTTFTVTLPLAPAGEGV